MGICPNCGSWVDEGDICMSCGGGGGRSDYDDSYSGAYSGFSPNYNSPSSKKRTLEFEKEMYERKLNEARSESNPENRIRDYTEALDYAQRYFDNSRSWGLEVEGMPEKDAIFSTSDIDWISRMHYDEYSKIHILSIDQTDKLEKLLKESGNAHKIKGNENLRRQRQAENARMRKISHVKYLRESYFEHIKKANEAVLDDKPKKAIKEYRKAVQKHEEYFKSDYMIDIGKLPEERFTPEAVDHIMMLYITTHPLLTSKSNLNEINAEILEMLDGKWDERVAESDVKVQKILEQKRLEREKRKERIAEIGVDMIVGARIAGDKIAEIFRK